MSQTIASELMNVIDLVTGDKLNKSGFITLIEATVLSVTDKNTGKYKVQYGDSVFEAIASNVTVAFTVGSRVKILLQKGDLSGEKLIINSVGNLGIEDSPIIPKEETVYIPVGGNAFSESTPFSLNSYIVKPYHKILYDVENNINIINFNSTVANTTLGGSDIFQIGADFRTNILEENQMSGNFGLKYTLEYQDPVLNQPYDRTFFLDINKMIGNPYKQLVSTFQRTVETVDGVNFRRVKKISAFVDNFSLTGEKPDDIFISNMILSKVRKETNTGNQIGGRNLVKNTSYLKDITGVYAPSADTVSSIDTVNKFNSNNSLKIITPTNNLLGVNDISQYLYNLMMVGQRLVVSFYIKGTEDTTGFMRLVGATSDNLMQTFKVTEEWTKVKLNLGLIINEGIPQGIRLSFGFNAAGTYWINSIMAEYGDSYSDWLPAPEDSEDSGAEVENIPRARGPYGLDLIQGIQGETGIYGLVYYTHIAYANSADGSIDFSSSDAIDKSYIGAYMDTHQGDPTGNYAHTLYKWSLIDNLDDTLGIPVRSGVDSKAYFFHTAWANSLTGSVDFSTTDSENKLYIGTYTDNTQEDSLDYTKYNWQLIILPGNENALDLFQGPNGEYGMPGPNQGDGSTPYYHLAYADDSQGNNLSFTDNTKPYIGFYVDTLPMDSLIAIDYQWTAKSTISDGNGIPGAANEIGTPYIHIAYANDMEGDSFSTDSTNFRKYVGYYVDYNQTDSSDPSLYIWHLSRGPQGLATGVDSSGRTLFTWIRYANTPTTGMSQYPNDRAYIGIAYNKTTLVESEDYSDYYWSLANGKQPIIGADGVSPYNLKIISTNGDTFTNSEVYTTLIVKVYQGTQDITDSLPAERFSWKKITANEEEDTVWSQNRGQGVKTITITKEDISSRATFFCELLE